VQPGDVRIVRHCDPRAVGKTLPDIAGVGEAWDVLCALVGDDPGALIVVELMSEDDVQAIMRDPLVAVGSDNGPPVGLQHPRTWGCFPRVLGRYVRDLGVLSWEEAIRKMTSMAARQFHLAGRGALQPGMVADICVFDPGRIGHAGTALHPDVRPQGVETVLVAGRVVLRDGLPTGERHGRLLRPESSWGVVPPP
jgi:N-acyl-D-amino-acid deacylase